MRPRLLTQERLKELFLYDPDTGIFTRRITVSSARAGSKAGTKHKEGYLHVKIDWRMYEIHHLAFLYMTGRWATDLVDHRDRDPSNNRWNNLREASKSQNRVNSKQNNNNTSGFRGVQYDKRRKKWRASTSLNGKRIKIGFFKTPEEAHLAYRKKAKELFGEFAPS